MTRFATEYRQLSDDELLQLWVERGELVADAQEALRGEIRRREITKEAAVGVGRGAEPQEREFVHPFETFAKASALKAGFLTAVRVLIHAILSVVGALACGFSFHTYWRPLVGRGRYNEMARSPLMVVLLLVIVAVSGILVYLKWHDRRAFFAWVVPLLWIAKVFISRGSAGLDEWPGILGLVCLAIATAYSIGAVIVAGACGELRRSGKADATDS